MPNEQGNWGDLIKEYKKTDINYPALKLVTLAQWALESGYGRSKLATEHNNFSGLKYRDRMAQHANPVSYGAHDGVDIYCKFTNISAFIVGYWHFIESGPYSGWEDFGENPLGFIRHLKSRGFAGDPNYVEKVMDVFNRLSEELDDFEEADRPPRRHIGDTRAVAIELVAGRDHRIRGDYHRGLEGLIVHYDAFRIKPKFAEQENSDWASVRTIEMGTDYGYRYLCISRTGRIFGPSNWDWDHWGYHAGRSKCPVTDRTGVSRYYAGIEMNNPGLLFQAQEENVFCPWYNSRLRSDGMVELDGRGRCYRVNARDEWYTAGQVRHATGGNIYSGYYLPYTMAQFEALKGLVALAASQRPSTFRYDLVLGHDEVSPGRKQDPGGALAYEGRIMQMDEFRREVTP